MACTTLANIVKDCLNNTGGLRAMWVFDMSVFDAGGLGTAPTEDNTTWSITSMDIDAAPKVFEFLRNVANYTEEKASEFTNGNNDNTVTITLMFNRREASKSRALSILGEGQRYLGLILLDENGVYWYCPDARITTVGDGSGTARTDGSKYAVTLVATIDDLMKVIDSTDAATLIATGAFAAS